MSPNTRGMPLGETEAKFHILRFLEIDRGLACRRELTSRHEISEAQIIF